MHLKQLTYLILIKFYYINICIDYLFIIKILQNMQSFKIGESFRKKIFYFSLSLRTPAQIKHRFLVRFIFFLISFSGAQNLMNSQELYPFVYQCTSMRASARVISLLECSHHKSQLSLLVLVNKPR